MIIRNLVTGSSGGISMNAKTGLPDAARFIKNLDIYTDQDMVTLNPGAVKDSGSIVTDFVKWIEKPIPYSSDIYMLGDTGNIYKNSAGVYTVDRTIATGSPTGQGLGSLRDYLYYATSTTLGRLGPFSGTPAYDDDFVSTLGLNVDISTSNSGQTYTTPTSIAETSTAKVSWNPAFDPLKSVIVNVAAKGTGNWTLTVHDSNNTSLGSATIANASVSVGNNTFTFSTAIRLLIGSTYHFHVTSTVADGTVTTSTASDLSTAQYQTIFGTLIADTLYHPIMRFTNGTNGIAVIGNDHYLSVWNPFANVYNPNQIQIEPGYTVRSFTRDSEFLVALCWKGTSIDSEEEGRAYYWDGIAPYYNVLKPITGGLPNTGVNFKNRVFSILGSTGEMHLGTEPFKKLQPAPKLAMGKKIEVLPGAIDVWRSKAVIGFGINTDDANFTQGVYEFGNQSDRALSYTDVSTEVLNCGYTISTGTTTGTTLKVGAIKAFGKDMYIAWADNGTYGVDKVSKTGNAAATASWESLVEDRSIDNKQLVSMPLKEKMGLKVVVKFLALSSGVTITAKYKLDRAANWTSGTGTTSASTDPTRAEIIINKRYKEAEFGFDITSSGNYCSVIGVYFEFDALENERGDN